MDDDIEAREQTALVPIEHREINFYGDSITAVLVQVEQDGEPQVYIPLRPLCENLGLDWSGQLQRTKRDEVLNEALISVVITPTQIGRGQRRRELTCLLLEQLPGWLFGIDVSRVKPVLQPKMVLYRKECFRVLWRVFESDLLTAVTGGSAVSNNPRLTIQSPTIASGSNPDIVALEQIRATAMAVVRLTEQQLELVNRLDNHNNTLTAHEARLEQAALFMGRLQKRVAQVEDKLAPANLISNAQAEQIKSRVHALAAYLMQLDPRSRLPYAAIFAELYRRFGVSEYHNIQIGQFDSVMGFLNEVREAAGAGRLPDQLSLFDSDNGSES